jgi:hypothetical protein
VARGGDPPGSGVMLRSGHHNTQVERPSVGFRTARDSLHDVEIGDLTELGPVLPVVVAAVRRGRLAQSPGAREWGCRRRGVPGRRDVVGLGPAVRPVRAAHGEMESPGSVCRVAPDRHHAGTCTRRAEPSHGSRPRLPGIGKVRPWNSPVADLFPAPAGRDGRVTASEALPRRRCRGCASVGSKQSARPSDRFRAFPRSGLSPAVLGSPKRSFRR